MRIARHNFTLSSIFRRHTRTIVFVGLFLQILLVVRILRAHRRDERAPQEDYSPNSNFQTSDLGDPPPPPPPPKKFSRVPNPYQKREGNRNCDCECMNEWIDGEVDSILKSGQFSESLPQGVEWYESTEDTGVLSEETAGIRLRNARLVDEDVKRDSSIPGVEDVYAQLKYYLIEIVRDMTTNMTYVKQAQHKPTSKELGIEPWDDMEDMKSIPFRIKLINELASRNRKNVESKVCIYTTSAAGFMGVRKELLPWIQYHTEMGISHFYVLYDGSDAKAVEVLNGIDHLTLIHIHSPFATPTDNAKFRVWTKLHKQWGGKPGNFELMVKQGYGTREALNISSVDGMEWLMHMDPDEFFYPDNPSFSLITEFAKQPSYVSSVRFMNFEGQPEVGDIKNRFEQVTLFRAHKHFITPEAYALRNKCKLGDNKSFLVLYANGKSAVRVDAEGARQLGPHYFKGNDSERWKTPENPMGEWRDKVSNTSYLLHYAYSQLSDVEQKAHRSCPPEYVEAAIKGNKAKVQSCFVIDFDRDAFLAASVGEHEDFFFSRMVLSEGARIKCRNARTKGWCLVKNVEYFKALLLKTGLIRRVREPQQILRSHESIIRLMMKTDSKQSEENSISKRGGLQVVCVLMGIH
ncbi:hypothetical protein BSKO_09465 [Bryopsis sp. KO-2023]|nr:hypothetical protein BSKO_09465 [Bryopsis sp. KO-2023]